MVAHQMIQSPYTLTGSQPMAYPIQTNTTGWMQPAASPYIVHTPVSSHMGGSIITQTPGMEHGLGMQSTAMMPQITHQMNHLQLAGSYMPAIPYTHMGQQTYAHGTTVLQPGAVEEMSSVSVPHAPDASHSTPHTSHPSSPQEQVEDMHAQGQPQQYYAAAPVVTAHAN